jgi:hypothetical protein
MKARVSRIASLISLAVILVLTFLIQASTGAPAASTEIAPNSTNMLDCNGLSPVYKATKVNMKSLCTDPVTRGDYGSSRFYDNGKYIGHDEPSVKFVSSAPGSGNHMTYLMQLAVDPAAAPTANGSVTKYAELSIAPWFGLPMCDPKSYPQQPCTPDSDSNTGLGSKTDAGSAFMELQFYPPGFGPFKDAFSCDQTQYCVALTIDSLSCSFNFKFCNNNCIEPVNFAYLQTDGVPAGPPSPQLINDASFAPNDKTLKMNPGDKVQATLQDTPAGFLTTVTDLTTGQTGFMVASEANGFMNTNSRTCGGTPFAFHPEYDTASKQNQVPWAALEGGVLMQQEIGHFESCSSVSTPIGFSFDQQAAWTCNGGLEPGSTGEGPCNLTTGVCTNPTTQGGTACPAGAGLCEFSDAICAPSGPRTVVVNGANTTWNWAVAACEQDFTQNGDLDFDGNDYIADWPNGSSNFPTSFKYAGPFDAQGNTYPNIQFETDLAASENDCNLVTGAGCTAPPHGSAFYPFWTIGVQPSIAGSGNTCEWNFGNTIKHVTNDSFGGTAEYGMPNTARFAGTIISAVIPNPQLNAGC